MWPLPFLIVASVAIGTQVRPDFTGTWTQVDPPLSSTEKHVLQIERRGLVLTLHVEKSGPAGRTLLFSFKDDRTYTIGAPPESRTDGEGRVRTVSVDWQGDALAFLRTETEGANTTTEHEVLEMSADGKRLTRTRATTSWRGTSTDQAAFERR
jgi:hypothetical protein